MASSTPFLPEHIVEDDGGDDDGDNSVARPVKEVLGHLEILQLDCWKVTNEHPKHLIRIIIISSSSFPLDHEHLATDTLARATTLFL